MFEARSALAAAVALGGRDGADGRRLLRLSELRGWHLLQLGVFAQSELAQAVRAMLDTALPQRPQQPAQGKARVYRIAQDQYWVVTCDATLPGQLLAAIAQDIGTVTSLSHARVRVRVSGAPARSMLAGVLAVDLHPTRFKVGEALQTGMHHLPVLVERTDEDSYEFYFLRTFAQTLWEWLTDAALRYGYDLEVTQV
jgi:heterotetrameric sarcosine oxidase gamma subunit